MRHWNRSLQQSHSPQRLRIFTLPMRHWNLVLITTSNSPEVYFYPTYEALKHGNYICDKGGAVIIFTLPMRHWNTDIVVGIQFPWFHFYPTYEALKLIVVSMMTLVVFNFYPTYEALKQNSDGNNIAYSDTPFLPYLWGIETIIHPSDVSFLSSIFTLPMRHWNFLWYFYF